MSRINFELPFFFFFVFITIGFFLSWYLYRKEIKQNNLSKAIIYLLFFLRFSTFTILSIFLLQPKIVKSELVEEKPILVFAQDNSKSIVTNIDSIFYKKKYSDSIRYYLNELSKYYDVRTCVFGREVKSDTIFTFSDNYSNFENLYDFVSNKYHGTNITDLIIASDGIVNRGQDLSYLSLQPSISVNTVLLGDTNDYDDMMIKSINNNKYALLENNFPIEASIYSNKNFQDVEICLFSGSDLLQEKKIKYLKKGISKIKFIEKAKKNGNKVYRVVVKEKLSEKNILNNSIKTSVEIIDYSQKILILTSGPHPDISALNWALEDQLKSKVSTFYIDDFDEQISNYDLVIFYKPTENNEMMRALEKSRDLKLPSLIISGSKLKPSSKNNLLLGLKQNNFKGTNKVSVQLNNDFKSFRLEEKWLKIINDFPPITVPFSVDYKLVSNANILAYQSINNLKMNYPMIYFFDIENTKHAVIMGEGIWRWKMTEFKSFNNSNVFKQFFKKILQYLKKIDKKLRLNTVVPIENFEDDPLYVYAEYYNEIMEIENEIDIEFSYSNSSGKEFSKNLISRENFYDLKLNGLPLGKYKYKMIVKNSTEKIVNTGVFSIVESPIEKLNTVANHSKLSLINQNGSSFYFSNFIKLKNQLMLSYESKIKAHNEKTEKDLINFKWLILLLLLPFLEWFLRKNKGMK